jgi:hypothetical protein
MLYHPHAHFLVSAGGLSCDGQQWVPAKNPEFLVPVRALSVLFRAKLCDGLKAAAIGQPIAPAVWKKKWVVHAQHAGSGQKVLDYLGRYVFRIAIAHSRLESLEASQVTFRYRDNRTQITQRVRLPVAEFVQRFLQHVLPRGLAKVRHYGLGSAVARPRHAQALALLQAASPTPPTAVLPTPTPSPAGGGPTTLCCPCCHTGRLLWLGRLPPLKKIPP